MRWLGLLALAFALAVVVVTTVGLLAEHLWYAT